MKAAIIPVIAILAGSGVVLATESRGQEVLEKKISLEVRNQEMLVLLNKIEEAVNIRFIYSPEVIPVHNKVSLKARNDALGKVLERLFAPYNILFEAVDNQIVLRKKQAPKADPADKTIRGQVTDENNSPLPGVSILIKDTGIGTTTDVEGKYSLNIPTDLEKGILVVSFIGYETQEIAIGESTSFDIRMIPEIHALKEVVVIGYGTQRKQSVTGAVKQFEGKDLADQPSVQTSAGLMGKVAGVQVMQNSGQPGDNEGTIRIRGTGTLGNSNPLVLIDGVPGDLDDVSSSDIESISILKDAASGAVYGSRAANGVILVTTKRGEQDQMRVNYRGFIGWQQPTDQVEMVDGGTFMRLENLAAENVGNQRIWTETHIQGWEANYKTDPDNYPNTDWVDLIFTEPGFQQKQHLDISGGTDKFRYFSSLTYDEENGNIPNYNFKRYAFRLNTDVNVSEKLGFVFDLNVQRSDRKQPVDDNVGIEGIIVQAFRVPPVYPAKYTNGGWGFGWNGQNPLAFVNDVGTVSDETSVVNGRMKATYQPADMLELEILYAPKYRSGFHRKMAKQYEVADPNTGEVLQLYPNQNSLFQQFARDFVHNANLTARYHPDLGNHNLTLLAGYEFVEFRTDLFNAFRDNYLLESFEQLNAGSAANQQNAGTAESWALQSFFGRATYDLKSKYLLEATVRYDGSSRFTEDNRWGMFPSFSAGWVISEESFMESVDFLTSLKVRGSWGKLGNQQIGTYPFASVIDLGQNFIFGGNIVSGGAQLALANPNITWEETTTRNIGLDGSLLNDRIYFAFDLFDRRTQDILLELPIPLIIGLRAPFQNAGKVRNTGWELEAGYSNKIGSDFSYSLSVNLSDVKNEVTDLKGAGPFIIGNSIIQEGNPVNAIYGLESDGLFQSQEEINNHATQPGQIGPGDIRYVDQNKDGLINAVDRIIIGDPFPSMNYGINISAKYKNFDLSALIQGVGRRDVLLHGAAVMPLSLNVKKWQAEDFWTPDNPDATYPRLTPSTQGGSNHQVSDYWVYNASYLRLRNLQVGYSLPGGLTNKLSLTKARIFFLGQNLLTLLDDLPPGIDPNVPSSTGGNYFPVTRLLSCGIDITF